MKSWINRLVLLLGILLQGGIVVAGEAYPTEFDGKYGVFVAVALIVLVGIFFYLIRLDLKLRKLEKQKEEAK